MGVRRVTVPDFVDQGLIRFLNQQTSAHPLVVLRRREVGGKGSADQHPDVGFRSRCGQGRVVHGWGDDHFHELLLQHCLHGVGVELPVEGDDAAKGGLGVRSERTLVCVQQISRHRDAAGVGMLDDHTRRSVMELLYATQSGIGIGDVVVGQRLALMLPRRSDRTGRGRRLDVEGRPLVRVFAIAQRLGTPEPDRELFRVGFHGRGFPKAIQVSRNGAIVTGRMRKCLERQVEPGGRASRPPHRARSARRRSRCCPRPP